MTATSDLTLDLTDGILTVRLNRPESRNAQTPALWRELAAIGANLDPGVRAIVLSAEGKSFSAGLDRRMLSPEGIPGEGSLLGFATMSADELDAQIAAIARSRGAALATRNVADFELCGVELLNPWSAGEL